MARKGIQKVKTGCKTCKIRKVKCDEERPQCLRCSSTGRKCDGYVSPPPGTYSWSQLLHPSCRPTQAISNVELHTMSYFRLVVAPAIAGPLDSYFWTNIIVQVYSREVAVKHAILAISSLYKSICETAGKSEGLVRNDPFVTRHYNQAIAELRSVVDQDTTLVMCILFICLEFLRGDQKSAIDHCRHGINILNQGAAESECVREYIIPAFYRLSIFPYFFGASPDTFPWLECPSMTVKTSFRSLDDAHMMLNPLLAKVVRFVRSADVYRLGIVRKPEPDFCTIHDQKSLESSLDSWFVSFQFYKTHGSPQPRNDNIMRLLEIRWFICKIWLATSISKDEAIYDTHMDKFRAIVDLAAEAANEIETSNEHHQDKFVFEMGFGPFLAFVVIKCRSLKLRVNALRLMVKLSPSWEHCWDMSVISTLGRRTIEIEHDLKLNSNLELDSAIENMSLPVEEKRIRDSVMSTESYAPPGKVDTDAAGQMICFLMKDPESDGLVNREEQFIVTPLQLSTDKKDLVKEQSTMV